MLGGWLAEFGRVITEDTEKWAKVLLEANAELRPVLSFAEIP